MLILDFTFKGIAIQSAVAEIGVITVAEDHKKMTFAVNYRAPDCEEFFTTEYYSCDYDDSLGLITQAESHIISLESFKEAKVSS